MADVAIIGAGSWGIALAKVLHTNGNKVTVWSIVEDEITMLKEKHEHVQKLPGVKLPEDMEFTTDLESAVSGKAYLILAVPSVFTRSTAKSMADVYKRQDMGCVGDGLAGDETQVSICAKDSHGPYHYDVVNGLVKAARKNGIEFKMWIRDSVETALYR